MSSKDSSDHSHLTERPFVPHTPFSLRVTFSYDRREPNGGVRFASVERIRAIAPGIATAPPQPGQSGAWIEVRDAEGKLLYYRHLHDPLAETIETFADSSGQPSLSRSPNPEAKGEFTVLVPDLPNAASFTFHASPPIPASEEARFTLLDDEETRPLVSTQPAQEMVRMTFEELRGKSTAQA